MFKLPWEGKRMFAVLLATAGVMAVIYGGASTQKDKDKHPEISRAVPTATAPLLGDLLSLVASIGYALYEVLYKRYLALPSDPEREEPPRSSYAPIPSTPFGDVGDDDPLIGDLTPGDERPTSDTTVYPPPFGLYPNLLTSSAGIITFLFLWIPLPVLHYVGAEKFHWPTNWYVTLVISGIAMTGVMFNAGIMVISRFSAHLTEAQRTFYTDPLGGVGSRHCINRRSPEHRAGVRVGCGIWRWSGGGDTLEFYGICRHCRGVWNFGRRPCQTVAVG